MPVLAAATVLLFGAGVLIFVAGWYGTAVSEEPVVSHRRAVVSDPAIRRRVLIAGGVGLVALVVTRWVGLFFSVFGVVFMLQGLFVDRQGRALARDRLRAVTGWLEMLRDTVATGSGIARAVVVTSGRASAPIAAEVRRLAVRLDSMRFEDALWQFGADLDVPAADTAIAALVLATREQGSNLNRLLTTVITSTRKRVEQEERVEAHRAKFATAATLMVVVTGLTALVIIGGSAQFRTIYSSVAGQVVLMVTGLIFMAAIWVLRRMSRATPAMRLIGAGS